MKTADQVIADIQKNLEAAIKGLQTLEQSETQARHMTELALNKVYRGR